MQLALVVCVFLPATGTNSPLALVQLALCGGGCVVALTCGGGGGCILYYSVLKFYKKQGI